MAVYERVEGGTVVERVSTVENSMEDNRLGLAALDPASPWRLEGAVEILADGGSSAQDPSIPRPAGPRTGAPEPEPAPVPAPEPAPRRPRGKE